LHLPAKKLSKEGVLGVKVLKLFIKNLFMSKPLDCDIKQEMIKSIEALSIKKISKQLAIQLKFLLAGFNLKAGISCVMRKNQNHYKRFCCKHLPSHLQS